jgi:hypothetical protein
LNRQDEKVDDGLLKRIERVSGEIQLLALNIAVAAAKIANKQDLGYEVNQRLSQLVSQATQAVRHMNQVLGAAGAKNDGRDSLEEPMTLAVDGDLIHDIENSMESIIADSEKITKILSGIKKKRI